MLTTEQIAKSFGLTLTGADVEIQHVAIGTQHIRPGTLFIAVQGQRAHGIDYLGEAIAKGAVAVLTDATGDFPIPTLRGQNPRLVAGEIAAGVYRTAASQQSLFGVTGTNGKTSTVFYLSELLNALGAPSGLISSALIRAGDQILPAELTTPEAPRVHQILREMREIGQQHCAVEVSAQGLSRHRLRGLRFKVAGFSNLSRDHLDDYPNMEQYLAAKAELFTAEYADTAVLMLEDEWAKLLFEKISIPKVGIGLDYHYAQDESGIYISGKADLHLRVLVPSLMAKNLVLAAVMLLEAGFAAKELSLASERINLSVPGRLELVSEREPHVYVDYAHTPAAVEAAAKELKSRYHNLTILLAASGDRDQGKRGQMAKAAARYANRIMITDQHPRGEDPAAIRAQLRDAISDFHSLAEEADPALAIAGAVEMTEPGGAILWCGPGHLKYREVKGAKVPFDAVAEARKVLGHD